MFTKEELIALYNLVFYASKDITTNDEPLIDEIMEKLKQYKSKDN